jgi:transposase InsO family protein
MIAFIDEHKDRTSSGLRWGIEPICEQLPIAPATYYAAKKRAPSARTLRDRQLRPEILEVWEKNLCVYGADKVWDQLNKDGIAVARCTIERLMTDMGLVGCTRVSALPLSTGGSFVLSRRWFRLESSRWRLLSVVGWVGSCARRGGCGGRC